jgi:hypothetical protein
MKRYDGRIVKAWCSNPVIANLGMPTIQSVSRKATRNHNFVGKQRIIINE